MTGRKEAKGAAEGNRVSKTSEAGFFCPAYVGLRCLLLLAVLEGHYWSATVGSTPLQPLTFAVPCFFVLSGYLISHTLFAYEHRPWKQAARAFYVRRALRILPPFYVVLLIAQLTRGVPLLAWQVTYLFNIKVFLLTAFEPEKLMSFVTSRAIEALHLWSVDVEEQFYLLYPLFVAATYRRARTACLLVGIAFCIICRGLLYRTYYHSYYGGLPMVAGEYILWGCLMAWMDRRDMFTGLRRAWVMYASLVGFVLLAANDTSYGPFAQWKPPPHATLYAILLSVFVLSLRYSGQSLLARLLSWKVLAPIGRISYGAYLVHQFLNPVTDRLLLLLPALVVFPSCPRAVAGPLVTLAGAALLWICVEYPIERWRQRVRPTGESKGP